MILTGGKDMNYTPFGKFLKIFRIKRNEFLKDMAQKLGVSAAFLSAVETGKKKIPEDWIEKIVNLYKLGGSEKDELILSFEETNQSISYYYEQQY
jgi:transcriptional regulator with XRE-family HTH domain